VDDIINGTMAAAFSSSDKKFDIFNLGSGNRISLKEVIHLIEQVTGTPLDVAYTTFGKGDMTDTLADISHASDILDYSPKVGMLEGLKKEYKWLCENHPALI
jgi:nucleoside-diphosphate-sugar epimerase